MGALPTLSAPTRCQRCRNGLEPPKSWFQTFNNSNNNIQKCFNMIVNKYHMKHQKFSGFSSRGNSRHLWTRFVKKTKIFSLFINQLGIFSKIFTTSSNHHYQLDLHIFWTQQQIWSHLPIAKVNIIRGLWNVLIDCRSQGITRKFKENFFMKTIIRGIACMLHDVQSEKDAKPPQIDNKERRNYIWGCIFN